MGSKEEHRKSRSVLNEMKSAVRPAFDCDLYKRIELREMTKEFLSTKKSQYEAEVGEEYPMYKIIDQYSEKFQLGPNATLAWLAAQEAKEITKYLDEIAPIEEPAQT